MLKSTGTRPAKMAVILQTPDNYQVIRKTVEMLTRQTVCEVLQLVIVAPSCQGLHLIESDLQPFQSFVTVETGALHAYAVGYAAGIRSATAAIVALAEDHSFPEPDWAEALIAAHQQDWAAVGPVVKNGNVGNLTSFADFMITYGPWMYPAPAGVVLHLPGHNSSYKRDVLLSYGEKLEAMLDAETLLHADLRRKGYKLYLEPAARTAHVNFSLLMPFMRCHFYTGKMFAGTRLQTMSIAVRLVYILGAPLIPLVRLWRIFREMCLPGRATLKFFQVLPALLLGLTLDGLGQLAGHVFGVGRSRATMAEIESGRVGFVTREDRERMEVAVG